MKSNVSPEAGTPAVVRSVGASLRAWGVVAVVLIAAAALSVAAVTRKASNAAGHEPPPKSEPESKSAGKTEAITLNREAVEAAGIVTGEVSQQSFADGVRVAGTVEPNRQTLQLVTPLVAGRVEKVFVATGDRVRAGQPLALLSSPDIAELHARLHDAETRRDIAERNLRRVEQTESRVALTQARARLDQADAVLKRMTRLHDEGIVSRQELQDAETARATARAEFDYQSAVVVGRELQEARATFETTVVEVRHVRDKLRSYGADAPAKGHSDAGKNTSGLTVVAPMAGVVIEREVNIGAVAQVGDHLFSIANPATVWVVAAVPESRMDGIRVGTPVEIHGAALGDTVLKGRVGFIENRLNADTRTARVRVEVANPGERLKEGMFVEAAFAGISASLPVVPAEAVQRVGDRAVVFVPGEKEGTFEPRDVRTGETRQGLIVILEGLKPGDTFVAKGGFALKTQMLKSQLEED